MTVNVTAGPDPVSPWLLDAIRQGEGKLVPAEDAEVVVWEDHDGTGLGETLARGAGVRWVQLPAAGIEWLFADGVYDPAITWTCAKGAYAEHVAEHALVLLLAALRDLRAFLRADHWLPEAGANLYDKRVCIVGGGGIARALLAVMAPFRVDVTVVRRTPGGVAGANRTVTTEGLRDAIADVDAVVLACSLTPATEGLIGEAELEAMARRAWLVNVARGRLVRTPDLVRALEERWIAGAALDVTEPEPLPQGHRLWSLDNCLITPHVANSIGMSAGPLAERVSDNLRRFAEGRPLLGLVDVTGGY